MEVDSISPEIQPVEVTDTESVTVKVENPNAVSKHSAVGSVSTCCKSVLDILADNTGFCLLLVLLSPVLYPFVTVATVAILPLGVAAFVVVRLLQFFIKTENFKKHLAIKLTVRYWISVDVMLLLVEAALFYPIAKYVPGLKVVTVIGLAIAKWIKIICILSGICLLSQAIWLCLNWMMSRVVESIRGVFVAEVISEIIDCLLFWWAEVIFANNVPNFKRSTILGLYTRKWIEVFLFVLIGHNVITLLTHVIVWLLMNGYGDNLGNGIRHTSSFSCIRGLNIFNKRYVVYVARGIKRSIIFILSTMLILLTWVLYFDEHLKKTSDGKKVLKFGMWSFVSVLICAFFWLIKSCIMLYWEAYAMYDKFWHEIFNTGKQLYFLVLLSNQTKVAKRTNNEDASGDFIGCELFSRSKMEPLWILTSYDSEGPSFEAFARDTIRKSLIKLQDRSSTKRKRGPDTRTESIYDIQQAAELFLKAQNALWLKVYGNLGHLRRDYSKSVELMKKTLESIVKDETDPFPYYQYQDYQRGIWICDDWELFNDLVSGSPISTSFEDIETWMEKANSSCSYLANKLIGVKEAAICLNHVISWLIIAVTFIMWLLLTGLATTSVLVLIATPVLAASFIFGDTCKSLFQGLLNAYVIHPFDVGDLCLIDQQLLEVKKVGVWNTIFSEVRAVGSQPNIVYTYSELNSKHVINYKTEFNWNDYLEISLSPSNFQTYMNLKYQIKGFLEDNSFSSNFVPEFHSVEFLEVGEKDKIGVHVKYKVDTTDMTFFECLKEKERLRYDLSVRLRSLLREFSMTNDY